MAGKPTPPKAGGKPVAPGGGPKPPGQKVPAGGNPKMSKGSGSKKGGRGC